MSLSEVHRSSLHWVDFGLVATRASPSKKRFCCPRTVFWTVVWVFHFPKLGVVVTESLKCGYLPHITLSWVTSTGEKLELGTVKTSSRITEFRVALWEWPNENLHRSALDLFGLVHPEIGSLCFLLVSKPSLVAADSSDEVTELHFSRKAY